jgi:hypothetical protein
LSDAGTRNPDTHDPDAAWWYNLRTGSVEQGAQSSSYDRVGPFASKAEAERAPDTLHERSRRWAAEDAEDN